MIPTLANGQSAAAAYHRDSDGLHRAFGLGVLTVTRRGIARIFVFGGGPDLVAKFGLPPVHPGRGSSALSPKQMSPPRFLAGYVAPGALGQS
jgi:RNA polymerase sigma-70 factor (ECF subfamily)